VHPASPPACWPCHDVGNSGQPGGGKWGEASVPETALGAIVECRSLDTDNPAALLDRLTHRCHILEMNGDGYCLRESVKAGKKGLRAETAARDGDDRPPSRDAQEPESRHTENKTN